MELLLIHSAFILLPFESVPSYFVEEGGEGPMRIKRDPSLVTIFFLPSKQQ